MTDIPAQSPTKPARSRAKSATATSAPHPKVAKARPAAKPAPKKAVSEEPSGTTEAAKENSSK